MRSIRESIVFLMSVGVFLGAAGTGFAASPWSFEAEFGMARMTNSTSGLPSDVLGDVSPANGLFLGVDAWKSFGARVEIGSGVHLLPKGLESTTMDGTSTITYTSNDQYLSIPVMGRLSFAQDTVYVFGGLSGDLNLVPTESDAQRRLVFASQAGVGVRFGPAQADIRYHRDLTPYFRATEAGVTVEQSFDGFVFAVGYAFSR